MVQQTVHYSTMFYVHLLYSHYGFVVFKDEHTAEQAASQANKTKIFGGKIVARGPAEQRGLGKGYSGEYKGRIGHVPTMDNDSRHLTQCKHYVDGTCTSGSDVSVWLSCTILK